MKTIFTFRIYRTADKFDFDIGHFWIVMIITESMIAAYAAMAWWSLS